MSYLIATIILPLVFPLKTGHAYLDPGSGSFIIQLLLASLVGGLFILKTYWRRITGFFRKSAPNESDEVEDEGKE